MLRVRYLPAALPFAFFNEQGDLVGFDVELAHRLAREMGVTLAFVPVHRDSCRRCSAEGYCDLVMSGVLVTTLRAREMLFSDSYLDETLALLVKDDRRDRSPAGTGFAIGRDHDCRSRRAVLPEQGARAVAARRPPGAYRGSAAVDLADEHVDALLLPAERGSAWTLIHPVYAVVVPGPDPIRVPLAYPSASGTRTIASFVNTWIALKRKDGTLDAVYRHWILGQDAAPHQPRWSIFATSSIGWSTA